MVKEGLSSRLQKARVDCGLYPRDVAATLHVSLSAVSQWEKGKSFPDVGNLVKLSDLYGVSLDWLLKGENLEAAEKEDTAVVLDYEEEAISASEIQKKEKDRTFQEILSILLMLVLSCHLPFVGVCAVIIVAIWMKKTERKYKWMYVVCFFAGLVCIYNAVVLIDYWFWDWGKTTIEIISSL